MNDIKTEELIRNTRVSRADPEFKVRGGANGLKTGGGGGGGGGYCINKCKIRLHFLQYNIYISQIR